ncbi:hypothetical protein ACOI1C_16275 [Bacillus sp. DJP31]|uniref:hypothetical protein n=1 Tax=Bacillus sp. DJP31 TaxID=3409789 RepID=UPI003BB55C21
MRKYFILLLSFTLFGCSNSSFQEANAPHEKEQVLSQKKIKRSDVYVSNPQVPDDRTLLKVGDSYSDRKGEITLHAIDDLDRTYNIGDIEMTIKDVKLIQLVPDYSLIDYFHTLTHEEQFVFAKVYVEIKNNSSENLNFAPVAIFETSEGENIPWENDIYLEDLNGVIEGQEQKFGNIGFILERSKIDSLTITTSDVFNKDEDKIQDAEKIKIDF